MQRNILRVTALLALLLLWPGICLGHGVNLFCWSEQDTVQCRASFSGDRPVHNGTWRLLESGSGKELLSGNTDSQGRFSFSPPDRSRSGQKDLKVVCEASPGHQDSWLLRGTEKEAAEAAASGQDSAEQRKEVGAVGKKGLREERIRSILRQELSPLRKELARLREPGLSLESILSGLGYILGLFGVWALTASRGRQR